MKISLLVSALVFAASTAGAETPAASTAKSGYNCDRLVDAIRMYQKSRADVDREELSRYSSYATGANGIYLQMYRLEGKTVDVMPGSSRHLKEFADSIRKDMDDYSQSSQNLQQTMIEILLAAQQCVK